MITVRLAQEEDVPQVRDIFLNVYGNDYPHQEFYDERWLKSVVYGEDVLMLVAEDSTSRRIAGTASVLFDIGAHSDLIGEFGRLAVHEDFRRLQIASLLMAKRIEAIEDRLHLGLVVARTVHPYAQKISLMHRFTPMGFLPLKYQFRHRESFALLGRYFGNGLSLRRNNPRLIPEAHPLAALALEQTSLPNDLIVDEESAPYPHASGLTLKELYAEGYPSLLRIERGRVRRKEVFGHMRLEYGFFKMRARHATYLLGCDHERIVGAVGFTHDRVEHTVRVFELITQSDDAIRFLLSELERKCRDEWAVEYLEIDVSAHAPRMQRTLLELHFLPVAYIPAMVFHEVERLDIVRMARLPALRDLGPVHLAPSCQAVADIVMDQFVSCAVAPRIARVVKELPLFRGLTDEQVNRLATACTARDIAAGTQLYAEGEPADRLYLILQGQVRIAAGAPSVKVGTVRKGELLGELSFLSSAPHSATAVAEGPVEAASLTHQDLAGLVRRRPDIGVVIYRNLAAGLGDKLLRSSSSLREQLLRESELLH